MLTLFTPCKISIKRATGVLLCLLLTSQVLAAGGKDSAAVPEFWPNTVFDEKVPTLVQVLGHDHGEKITPPDEVIDYLKALQAYAPGQTRLVEYATSWQGRPLVYMVISSEANMAKLEQNQANMQQLIDPRIMEEDEAKFLINKTLPVTWLSYGVHGDEISSSDAALLTAYYLLAASQSDMVNKILDSSYVVIDPSQNPDGRARFVESFRQTVGIEPAIHPLAAEHRQVWPGGRYNHYLFDMNRDWFAITQPESKGRIAHYQQFHPVVHADIHEMGVNESYYFPPPVEPLNPHISDAQKRNLDLYGKGNASAFDDFKFDYFTREVFDAYYPGYGDTWPGFQGAIGMTFEMASARGLAQLRSSGETLTYRDGIHRHFVASMATMLTTARHGNRLLNDYVDYRRSALGDKTQYIFRNGDPSLQKKLVDLLVAQGVEVQQFSQETRACGWRYDKGAFVVKAGQPTGRLVRTLLDAESPIEESFWEEQERKREAGLEVELYDILAWSLPALFNVEVVNCGSRLDNLVPYEAGQSDSRYEVREAKLAYLVPANTSASIQFLSAALRTGLHVEHAARVFTMLGQEFPAGTLIFKVRDNDQNLREALEGLANQYAVEVFSTDSGWTASGVNFGSSSVKRIKPPRVAIAWDEPTVPTSAGNTRFVIEALFGYPTTPVRTEDLASPEIKYFDVVILPNGYGYEDVLGERGLENLGRWVRDGGTLITSAAATRLLLSDGLDMLNTHLEANLDVDDDDEAVEGLAAGSIIDSDLDYQQLLSSGPGKPDYVPGVLVQGKTDENHWLAGGVAPTLNFMLAGNDVYTPLKHGDGTNLVSFFREDELVVGGYLWEENRSQLAYKPAVMTREVGNGLVVGFTTDPTFRGYLDGLHVLLGNAIFKGPAHTGH